MHNPGAIFLFVINPISGGKEKHDWEAAIRDHFKESSHRAEFYLMSGADDKRSVQHYIERIKPDKVVAVGGDGTVKMLAQLLRETPTPLGIIPAGSANGMAMELGIPEDVEKALEVVMNGEIKKIDLIRINEEEICIHLSDLGLNAMLVKYFEQSEKRGMWGYGKALFRVLWQKQKMKLTIHTEGRMLKRAAYMAVIANARKYGTGANINPEGDIADGKFEIVIVRKLNVFEIIKAIFTDRMFHPKRIEVIPVNNVEIAVHRKAHFQVDGEFKGKTNHVHARICPGVLNMIYPKAAD
jgi:diacylglycerol kinase (ATP)